MPSKHRYLSCHTCGKSMRSDNIQRHMKACKKNGGHKVIADASQHSKTNASAHQPITFPEKPMVGSLHSKTLNPKISALVDAIVNEKEEEPALKEEDSTTSSRSDDNDSEIESMDMTAKDMKFDDDRESTTSKDSYSGIEPMDMTAKQFEDEDSMTSKDDSTASKDNLSPDELKDRLYRFFDDMNVFELNIDADKRLCGVY